MHSHVNFSEKEVNKLAYEIWELEGRPIGQAERHWQMAIEQAVTEHGYKTNGDSTQGRHFLGQKISPEEHSDTQHYREAPSSTLLSFDDTSNSTIQHNSAETNASQHSRNISGSVSSDYIEAQNKKDEKRQQEKISKKNIHASQKHENEADSEKKSHKKNKSHSHSKQNTKKPGDGNWAI